MKNNIYRDSLHQLIQPIDIQIPLTTKGIKDKISGLHHAIRIEVDWSKTAYNEYLSERNRAMKLPKGDPLRNELLWDSRVALDFYKIRKARASQMLVEADKLEKALRGSK
jgi:hypothetical protein